VVLLNAAAALVVADLAEDLREGIQLAGRAVDSGDASKALADVVEVTQSLAR
jgi:anthranilate phosphoribosyltransferase